MKRLLLLFLFLGSFSCTESDTGQIEPEMPEQSGQQKIATDRFGVQYPTLDPSRIYCGPGWGIKFCRFLYNYDGTIWADSENYYSDFSDIKFSSFFGTPFFISFFNLDSTASYCEGWKLGETTYDGIKWNIEIKKDEEDVFVFDFDYYGASEEIEFTVTYKYEVIDDLLHFSSSDGQTFIFQPSERNYSEDFVETDKNNSIRRMSVLLIWSTKMFPIFFYFIT